MALSKEPLQKLIYFKEKGRPSPIFQTEALCEMRNEERPILVISIAGVCRAGKSFMLDLFITYLRYIIENGGNDTGWEECGKEISGFKYECDMKPVTKGVWLWKEPFKLKRKDGQTVDVYLMDYQGTQTAESTEDNKNIDNLLLYISVELSSIPIYNIPGAFHGTSQDAFRSMLHFANRWDNIPDEEGTLVLLFRNWQTKLPNEKKPTFGRHDRYLKEIVEDAKRECQSHQIPLVDEMSARFNNMYCYCLPAPGDKITWGDQEEAVCLTAGDAQNTRFFKNSKEMFAELVSDESLMKATINAEDFALKFELLWERIKEFDFSSITEEEGLEEARAYHAFQRARKFFHERLISVQEGIQLETIMDDQLLKLSQLMNNICNEGINNYEKECKDHGIRQLTQCKPYIKYQGLLGNLFKAVTREYETKLRYSASCFRYENASSQEQEQLGAVLQRMYDDAVAAEEESKKAAAEPLMKGTKEFPWSTYFFQASVAAALTAGGIMGLAKSGIVMAPFLMSAAPKLAVGGGAAMVMGATYKAGQYLFSKKTREEN